jgi:psp operon transcriptional activator
VRELKNLVERAVYRAAAPQRPIAELQFDPFDSPYRPAPADPAPAPAAGDFRSTVAAFERGLLSDALAACRHNQRRTAERLGLSYDQLRSQLRQHGLPQVGSP